MSGGVSTVSGSLRTDSAHHAVLWVSEWPRTQVYPGFLAPVLLTTGVRRGFPILYQPLRACMFVEDATPRC